MSLDIARLRLGDARFRIDKFTDQNMQEWIDDIVVAKAQKLAWAKGLSEDAISTIYSERMGFLKIKVVWDLKGPNGEPLAIFLEKGTIAHPIEAKGKPEGADSLMWIGKNGKPIFRKKVKHPGTKPMRIIERAWKETRDQLIKTRKKKTEEWLRLTEIGRR